MSLFNATGVPAKFCFCLAIAGLISVATSCKSPSTVEEPVPNKPATELVAEADQLYAQREDLMQARRAVVLLRQAHAAEPGNYDVLWRLAKLNYYLASHTDGGERDTAFRGGVEAGKAAVKLQAERPEGHFWLGANYGGSLEASGIAGLATVDDVRNEMLTVLRLDEAYQNGSAYMVLGLVDLKAPKILGGDPQKAVAEMEKGLRFGDTNAFLRLHLAEGYLAVERSADARQQLNTIISMTPDPNYLPEYKEALKAAQQLLATIK